MPRVAITSRPASNGVFSVGASVKSASSAYRRAASWFAAQGSTAAWTYAPMVSPWTQSHSYVLFSSATNVSGVAQPTTSSAAFTFVESTPTVFYAGADLAPADVPQAGRAAMIRFTLATPETGVALTSVTVRHTGSASDGEFSEVLLFRETEHQ